MIRDLRPAVPRRAHPRPTATGRERLTEYALAADDLLVPRRHGVATLTINVPTAQPAQEADEILQAEQSLRERRADLDELAMLLTSEHRRLRGRLAELAGGDRALYPADAQFVGTARGSRRPTGARPTRICARTPTPSVT